MFIEVLKKKNRKNGILEVCLLRREKKPKQVIIKHYQSLCYKVQILGVELPSELKKDKKLTVTVQIVL